MIRLTFLSEDGRRTDAEGRPGERLLDAAQRAGQPLEGTCGGDMACGTCHVIIPTTASLQPPCEAEEDMLDLIARSSRYSRLACQVRLDRALDGLTVTVPGR